MISLILRALTKLVAFVRAHSRPGNTPWLTDRPEIASVHTHTHVLIQPAMHPATSSWPVASQPLYCSRQMLIPSLTLTGLA